ncbi:hypothetical protein ES707_20230 [subsurface metagenome]
MDKLLIPILIGVAASVSMILFNLISHFNFSRLVNYIKVLVLPKAEPNQGIDSCSELDMSVLNCCVQLKKQQKYDAFDVQICGSIHTPGNVHSATLRISIMDITDSISEAKPVQTQVKQWQMPESSEFCYNAELGKLPHQVTTISSWTSVAQLHLDWLAIPRKGKRNLMFKMSIHSVENGEQLACAKCTFTYDNPVFGYIDLQENIQRTKTLAVALAFAVSAADNKMYDCEIELIKNWAVDNIDISGTSSTARRKLKKALNETIAFFRDGNHLNACDICREMVEIAPLADRYDILNLCLHVAQANGSAACEEISILKKISNWLDIDEDKFRAMMQKVLPIDIHQVKDVETILGVTSDMNKEKARRHLNKEYSKWSARVTNPDPEIQTQADQMLKLIAETRSQYIG